MSLSHNFSENIKAIRISRKLSIAEFAEELCVAKSSIQTILRGKCNVRMDTVNHIASQLDIEPLALLQEPYTPNQLSGASVLLGSIKTYQQLSAEDRKKADAIFHDLIMLLDKYSEK